MTRSSNRGGCSDGSGGGTAARPSRGLGRGTSVKQRESQLEDDGRCGVICLLVRIYLRMTRRPSGRRFRPASGRRGGAPLAAPGPPGDPLSVPPGGRRISAGGPPGKRGRTTGPESASRDRNPAGDPSRGEGRSPQRGIRGTPLMSSHLITSLTIGGLSTTGSPSPEATDLSCHLWH